MSDQMDPRVFAARLDASFGSEPGSGDPVADLARGRRGLRRRRAAAGAGVAGVSALATAVLLALPGGATQAGREAQPATGGGFTDAQVLERCTHPDGVSDDDGSGGLRDDDFAALRRELPAPALVTRGDSALGTVATVRGSDGERWGDCDIFLRPAGGIHTTLNVYRTRVSFPRREVDGRVLYDPHNEADRRIEGSATSTEPVLFTPCVMTEPEDTAAYRLQQSRCDRFSVTWNDRRPAEVAAARVRLPTGEVVRAEVDHGYLSMGYTGAMTPRLARLIRTTEPMVSLDDVTFLDADGAVIASGHGLGDRRPGIERFPSLALWLK